jgi:hypothetical protein
MSEVPKSVLIYASGFPDIQTVFFATAYHKNRAFRFRIKREFSANFRVLGKKKPPATPRAIKQSYFGSGRRVFRVSLILQ